METGVAAILKKRFSNLIKNPLSAAWQHLTLLVKA